MPWVSHALGDVCTFENGDRGKNYPSKSKFIESGIPFVNAGHLENGSIDKAKLNYISRDNFDLLSRGKFKPNDILFCLRGSLGKFAKVDNLEEGGIASSLVIIRTKELLDTNFFTYFLQSQNCKNMIEEFKGGTAQPNLGAKDLAKFTIELPDLVEQKQIIEILDQAFDDIEKVRSNAERGLRGARELFDSYLQKIFNQRGLGWNDYTLKEAALDFGRGKSKHRPRNDASLYGGDYPFIQTGDVRNSEHVISGYSKTYNDKGLAQSKLWPKDTICITIAANIAETGILDFEACFPDSVIGVVVNPEITTTKYVEYLLQSFKAILQAKGKGSAQDNINLGTFENLKFPFPSQEKQNEIVDALDTIIVSVQHLEEIYQNKITALDELKKSILQKAFTGELTKNTPIEIEAA